MPRFSDNPQFLGSRPLAANDAALFTREELIAAMRFVTDDTASAVAMARELTEAPDGSPLAVTQLTRDTLTLISLVSVDTSSRVQKLLGETTEQAATRMEAMRRTLGLSS